MKKTFSRLYIVTLVAVLALMLFSSVTAFAESKGSYNNYYTLMPISAPTKPTVNKPIVNKPTTTTTTATPETITAPTTPETTTIPTTPETTMPGAITTEIPVPEIPAIEIIEEDPSITGIYYVSKEGSDSNIGSLSKPLKTIQKAADTAEAGQTIYIKGGTYNERVRLDNSGTSSGYITFSNYEGEEVIIDGTGIDWGYDWGCLFNLNSQKYIKVIGLRVINSRWAGIGSTPDENGCENVIVQDCETYNTQSSGITFFTGAKITIDGNSVEKACVKENGSQEGISLATIDTFTIKNNHVFNITNDAPGCGGEGIDAKNGCTNGKIYGNTVNNIAKIGIYIDAYSLTQKNIEVYDNNVYNCDQGITVANENGGSLEDVNIHDNTIEDCGWGMAIGGWDGDASHYMNNITFNNNTLSGTKTAGMYLGNPEVSNIQVTNNILGGSSTFTPIYLVGGVTLDETVVDGNIMSRIAGGHPTGTNYALLK